MASQCCRDSVAMQIANMSKDPAEGMRVECRWCADGYGVFTAGRWTFSTDLADRINAMASPDATAQRAARMREILGQD